MQALGLTPELGSSEKLTLTCNDESGSKAIRSFHQKPTNDGQNLPWMSERAMGFTEVGSVYGAVS